MSAVLITIATIVLLINYG